MAANKDYYEILGVGKKATDAEIKAAYRKKALEWHPDRNKSPQAAEKFKEVNQAYEVLSNGEKRAAYDQFGSAAFEQGGPGGFGGGQQGPFGGGSYQQGPFSYTYRTYGAGGENPFEGFGGFSDPFEIFEQFFGGGFTGGRQGRARRKTYAISISFMEAVRGMEKTVDVEGKQMKIKIPAGVDEGMRVRFGDFDVIVSVTPDKTFQREGANLIVDQEVDFVTATLGGTMEVPTLEGTVPLKVPAGTQPGTVVRLRGRGVKIPQSNQSGDEYIRVKIKIPSRLTSEQKQLLEEFRRSQTGKKSGWF